jgi:alkylation response protein AidB-like acyl-CoA dehydrogenase
VRRLAQDFRAAPHEIANQRASPASWETIGELGLISMRVPEDEGGAGASTLDVALVAEALASAPAVVPFVGPVLAAELILLAGPSDHRLTGSTSWPALTIALDPGALEQPALNGGLERAIAWDAAGSSAAVGIMVSAAGVSLAVIPVAGAEAIAPSADITRVIARVQTTADVAIVAELDPKRLLRWEAFALTLLSIDLVGTMAGALELAVAYAVDRKQFGAPIGSFQALQHMLADAYVSHQAARNATLYSAWLLDSGAPEQALLAARVAKAYAARVAIEVSETAMQIHGGMGITWESICHVFLRRATADSAVLGDEQQQLGRIADARLGKD